MFKAQIKMRWALPLILGLLFTLGDTVAANNGKLEMNFSILLPVFCCFAFLFCGLFNSIDKIIILLTWPSSTEASNSHMLKKHIIIDKVDSFFFHRKKWASTVLLFLTIILCWLPWLLLFFPGVFWSDTSQELLEHFGLATLSDHHPYCMTLILGWFADLGNMILGSVSKGLFLLICLQSIIAIYFFSRLIWELHDGGLGHICTLMLLLFVTLFPFIPLMFCSVAKDTLSCALFLGFILQIIIIVKSNGKKLLDRSVIASLTVCALIASLTKKTVGYVVLLCLLALLLAYKNRKAIFRTLGSIAVIITIVFIAFPKIILPEFYVQPGGKQEAIATLIQQVAHDVTYNGDDLSDSDRKLIDDFLLVNCTDIPSRYDWQIADPIKGRGLHNDSKMVDFIKLWAKNSLKHPLGHLESWLGLVDGWITFRTDLQGSPNYMVVLTYSGWHDEGIENCTDWNDQITDGGRIAETIYRVVQSLPIISLLFYRSTWATIVPFLSLFLLLGKSQRSRLERLVLAMPLLASLIPLAITPVSVMGGEPTRYLFSIVCTAPFLICASALFNCNRGGHKK